MKMHLTKPSAAQGAWLIAGRSAAGGVLLAITVSACTGGSSSVPSIFTPTPQVGGAASSGVTRTPSPSDGGSSTKTKSASTSPTARGGASDPPRATASASAKPPATTAPPAPPSSAPVTHASAPVTHTSTPVDPAFPTAAPETGGGGTAGLQDGLLFGVGGLAVFAGLGSLVLRRRLTRKFRGGQRTPETPDREPVDH